MNGGGPDHSRLTLRLRPRRQLSVARVRLAILPAAGGLALAVHILTGVRLPILFAMVVVLAGGLWMLVVGRAAPADRTDILLRLRVGLIAGLFATVAYDVVRYTVVAGAGLSLNPFQAWTLFGTALLGPDASESGQFVVGMAYHILNGLGFAVAFALVVRRPNLFLGIAWGLTLEFVMVWLYPKWMQMPQLQEFVTMSVLGHVAYGATLGLVAKRLLREPTGTVSPGSATESRK